MPELPPDDLSRYTNAAIQPYLEFGSFFKRSSRTRAMTCGWKRITHQHNTGYSQDGAIQAPRHTTVTAASIMALQFRSGAICVKAEVHDMEDGEFLESLDVGVIAVVQPPQSFWLDLLNYITESEAAVSQFPPGQTGNVGLALQRLFEQYLRKYGAAPTQEQVAGRIVRELLT